mmetsp:Transcript_159984/g.513318  ORF Transcript_159984/g.513318 Transcript_159984/m.513318 type:complete len:95 (-) Transcript_159984:63-347(-)
MARCQLCAATGPVAGLAAGPAPQVLPGSHKDAVGHASHQTRELPKDWLPSCPSNLATEKYRYYSEPMILDSVNFHHTNAGDGLALGRTTYRFSG